MYPLCAKNNTNLGIKTDPVTAGADPTVYFTVYSMGVSWLPGLDIRLGQFV